jgi:4-amino-4-deoxy-L-arabinose transferase-like glycosyltransferase
LLIVIAFWAAIFLPGLGSTEIKGEEGRRILPAMTMLDSGNWIVPYVGGEPYLRKPPLVNWLIGCSMKVLGNRSEWAARLPSVLCVLMLGVVIAMVCSPWLGARAATAAALFAIANVSIIEKGRLAEIEAVYVAFAGMAMVIWMAWALTDKNPWIVWTVPAALLGLALLAKGPTHLLFFYAVVLATSRGRREFFSVPHLAGVLLMVGIFACWAVPYFSATASLQQAGERASAAGVWQEQMAERLGGGSFVLKDWLLSLPRGLSNFLPWLLLVPLWWSRPAAEPWFRPVRDPVTAAYIIFLLIPGFLPRYTMPLLVPASVLLAVCLREPIALGWQMFRRKGAVNGRRDAFRFATTGSAIAAVAILVYAVAIIPRVNTKDDIRPLGQEINASLPPGERLFIFDPNYQPALFYIRPPIEYQNDVDKLPSEVPWLLCRSKAVDKFRKRWVTVEVIREFTDKQGNKLRLVRLAGLRKD